MFNNLQTYCKSNIVYILKRCKLLQLVRSMPKYQQYRNKYKFRGKFKCHLFLLFIYFFKERAIKRLDRGIVLLELSICMVGNMYIHNRVQKHIKTRTFHDQQLMFDRTCSIKLALPPGIFANDIRLRLRVRAKRFQLIWNQKITTSEQKKYIYLPC